MELGEGRLLKEGTCIYIYNYDWFMLMYGIDHHNIIKQFSAQLPPKKANVNSGLESTKTEKQDSLKGTTAKMKN